ncbi:MAG: phytanoyl-CoA dioxygenase family protein [Steroidobacteraceae bacterium]
MNGGVNLDIAFPKAELAQMRARYAEKGFIQVESLTTPDDIATIRSLIDPLFDKFGSLPGNAVILAGSPGPSTSPRQPEINEAVKLAPALRNTRAYARCRAIARNLLGVPVGYIFDHAIYKPPHYEIATPWHQDEIYNKAPISQKAVNFWIPLQPASIENGCLWYSPGSHLAGKQPHHVIHLRTAGETASQGDESFELDAVDESRAVPCRVAVGGATAHNPLTAHRAGPNNTDSARRAWILHFGAYGKYRYKLHPMSIIAKLRSISKR